MNCLEELRKNDSSETLIYGRAFKEETPIVRLYNKLIQPFLENPSACLDLSDSQVKVVEPDSLDQALTRELINFEYSARYNGNSGLVSDIAKDKFDSLPTTHTLVVIKNVNNTPTVLGTFRTISGDELDVFELFEMEKGKFWPHEEHPYKKKVAGEIGRFSIHPIFDLIADSSHNREVKIQLTANKKQLLRSLWPAGTNLLREEGVEVPYFILGSHAHIFVKSAGIVFSRVDGAIPNNSPYLSEVRNRYKEYWKPNLPLRRQPAVYIGSWEMAPINRQNPGF